MGLEVGVPRLRDSEMQDLGYRVSFKRERRKLNKIKASSSRLFYLTGNGYSRATKCYRVSFKRERRKLNKINASSFRLFCLTGNGNSRATKQTDTYNKT